MQKLKKGQKNCVKMIKNVDFFICVLYIYVRNGEKVVEYSN